MNYGAEDEGRFSINATGREAIDAIRRPLFVVLLLNVALTAAIVFATLIWPDWWAMKDAMAAWMR